MSEEISSIEKEIRRIGRNVNKDSSSRKSRSYIEKKLDQLKKLRITLNQLISREEVKGHDCSEAKTAANNAYEQINNQIQRLRPAEEANRKEDKFDDAEDNGGYEEDEYDNKREEDEFDDAEDNGGHEEESQDDPEGHPDTAASINTSSKSLKMSTISLSEALRLTPDFNGSAGELHRFISACETTMSLLSEADQLSYIKILKLKLTDKAYEVVKYAEYTTFKDLKKNIVNTIPRD